MIQGAIEDGLYPRLAITLHSQSGSQSIKALLDSGFDGQLALPYIAADHLQLEVVRLAEVTYANGQKNEEIVCQGEILWHNELRSIEIALSDDEEPAIGTALLDGCVVTMDFKGNTLSITEPT
jgi:clan AA aspartic protease